MTTYRIEIEAISIGHYGQRYRVSFGGRILFKSVREPLFAACRALAAQGIKGRLVMFRAGKAYPDMTAHIERGAGMIVSETTTHGPVLRPWRPLKESAPNTTTAAVRRTARAADSECFAPMHLGKKRPPAAFPATSG